MAARKIAFPVVLQKNTNSKSLAYGKYYPKAYRSETLSLKGLLKLCAFDQSIYSEEIVRNVIDRSRDVLIELLTSGQAVKFDGLGTFQPGIRAKKGGVTKAQLIANDPACALNKSIDGVAINFIPENKKGEQLTSRAFKDLLTFDFKGISIVNLNYDPAHPDDPAYAKKYNTLKPLDTYIHENE